MLRFSIPVCGNNHIVALAKGVKAVRVVRSRRGAPHQRGAIDALLTLLLRVLLIARAHTRCGRGGLAVASTIRNAVLREARNGALIAIGDHHRGQGLCAVVRRGGRDEAREASHTSTELADTLTAAHRTITQRQYSCQYSGVAAEDERTKAA